MPPVAAASPGMAQEGSASPGAAAAGEAGEAGEGVVWPPPDPECSICMAEFGNADLVRLACGHYFHASCAKEWYSSCPQTPSVCPLCRQEFAAKEWYNTKEGSTTARPAAWAGLEQARRSRVTSINERDALLLERLGLIFQVFHPLLEELQEERRRAQPLVRTRRDVFYPRPTMEARLQHLHGISSLDRTDGHHRRTHGLLNALAQRRLAQTAPPTGGQRIPYDHPPPQRESGRRHRSLFRRSTRSGPPAPARQPASRSEAAQIPADQARAAAAAPPSLSRFSSVRRSARQVGGRLRGAVARLRHGSSSDSTTSSNT